MANRRRASDALGRGDEARGGQPALRLLRRGWLMPLVALCMLWLVPGTALAGGSGPGLAISPTGGPAGTNVTVSGSRFTPNDNISIGYATGDCASGITVIAGAQGVADASGSVRIPFIWPALATGTYTVCATDTTTNKSFSSSTTFQGAGTDAPSITIDTPIISGKSVTVHGAHFKLPGGGTAEVLYGPAGSAGCATSTGTVEIQPDGSFTQQFNAPYAAKDTTIVITAVDPQGSCGSHPTLSATRSVTVSAAVVAKATATATATPVSTGTANQPGPSLVFPPTWPPSGPWTVVYCLVGLLLLLLLLLMVLLLGRRNNKNDPEVIKQKDTVAPAGPAGTAAPVVQSQIYAENPRGQQRTPIAEVYTSVQEEILPPDSAGAAPASGAATGTPPAQGPGPIERSRFLGADQGTSATDPTDQGGPGGPNKPSW